MTALQIAGLVVFAALVVVLWRLQRQGIADHGRFVQPHHGYAVLLALVPSIWVQVPALVFGLDDVYQHHRQHREPFYRSPVHRLAHRVGII